jgi:hypothetical protein
LEHIPVSPGNNGGATGTVPHVANAKVYIHELVDVIGHNRAAYMHHMTANWGSTAREERNMLCFGVWATVGSTGRWPQTVNLWELDGWRGMAASFRHEFSHTTLQDPSLESWWAQAATLRSGGLDRLLVPAPYAPTLEEALAAGIRGEVYSHEIVTLSPGTAPRYLSMLEQDWMPEASRLGLRLVGAYRSVMCDASEAVVIWAIETWERWAEVQTAYDEDPAVAGWRLRARAVVRDWRGTLLVDSPLNPLRTGNVL